MTQTIRLKRSSDAGHIPTTDDLALGELAVNTADGTVFMRKTDDTIINVAGETYTAGDGISISDDGVISSEGLAAGGTNFVVQINDGAGKLSFVPQQPQGRVLTSNGDQPPTWEPVPVSGGTVRSISMDGGDTGFKFNPAEITTRGTFTMSGVLSVESGGTGGSSIEEVVANILPDQSGHPGSMLTTDGNGVLSWEKPPGAAFEAGVGLKLDGITFNSTVANNTGDAGRVTVSKGDGTLENMSAGNAGQVLISQGPELPPTWDTINGTVSEVRINRAPEMGMYISGGDAIPSDPYTTQITKTGQIGLSGVLSVNNGGTGSTTVYDARTRLLPTQSEANRGKFLMTNGNDVSWVEPTGLGGTVTSVLGSGGDTGMTLGGGPITSEGTLTLGGRLKMSNGGTGADNAVDARNNLLPKQEGMTDKVLMTDGTNVTWGIPAGLDGTVKSVDIDGGDTGMRFSGGPVTTTGKFTMGGKLAVQNGGTGVDSMQDLQVAVLPNQKDKDNLFLTTKDGVASWGTPAGLGGTVKSVDMDGGDTGMRFSGGPVTTSGKFTMGGKLTIANGGTGADNAADAINALVPRQNGNAGRILTTDGTIVKWTTASAGSVTSVDIDGSTTGLKFNGGPITEAGKFSVAGTLALAHGGTGGTSAQAARNNILPPQSTHEGQALITNGVDVYWSDTTGTGTVTSVGIDGGTTGLTFGDPITNRGTFKVAGKLAITNGGTGASDATSAFTALAPAQKDKAGYILATNGTAARWAALSELSMPAAGSATQVMYNKAGVLAGSNAFTFNETMVTMPALNVANTIEVNGGSWGKSVAVTGGAVDLSKSNVFTMTSTAATSWTFTVPVAGKSYIFALSLVNGGQFTQTWPAAIRWPGNSAPSLSPTGTDVLVFFTDNGGTTWRGAALLNYATN